MSASTMPTSVTLPAMPAAGDPAVNHPLVQGYLCELPPVGSHLDRDERIALERLNHEMLNILYHPDHSVQVGVVMPPAASTASSASSNGNGSSTTPAPTDPTTTAANASTDTSSAASLDPSATAAAASS